MENGQAICQSVGLTPTVLKRYAEVVRDRYLSFHQPPAGITREEMQGNIDAVIQGASKACSDPVLATRAATVIGFATVAAAIDKDVSLAERYRLVQEDYLRFTTLVALGGADTLKRFREDIDFVTDQFFWRQVTEKDPVPSNQPIILKRALDAAVAVKREGKKAVVVFDLDGTLLDPTERTVRILHEFTEQNPDGLPPTQLAMVQSIMARDLVYDVTGDLQTRWNISNPDFLKGLKQYWFTHFFTSEYAAFDGIYPGAPEYVGTIARAGATVVYLTGRQETGTTPGTEGGMREGTLTALRRLGFPMPNGKTVHLMMKRTFEEKDADYKQAKFTEIDTYGRVVAAFENEPKAVTLFREHWPQALAVRVGRSRAPNPTVIRLPDGKENPVTLQDILRVPKGAFWIQDFRTNGKKIAGK